MDSLLGGPGGARTLDTLLKSPMLGKVNGFTTPVMWTLPNAPDSLKLQQTAAEIAELVARLDARVGRPIVGSMDHQTCGLGHKTEWLIRELLDRLRDEQAGGDRAA